MIVAKIRVYGVHADIVYKKTITSGMVGACVDIEYVDPIWNGLLKTVVFSGAVTKDNITGENPVEIPAECLTNPGIDFEIGVCGFSESGKPVIPMIPVNLGRIMRGTDPSGDTTTDPSLPVWAQLQAMIGDLDDLDTTAKENLVAAVNEAITMGSGEVDEAEIQRIVDAYLAANPPHVTETDPTVPAWAKQPSKPSYTAEEVGALPDTYTPPNQTAQQVGADPAGTATTTVSQHNTDTAAHNDLRIALKELADRVNAALDSDDTTLDQMSEVVAYIKSNKTLIDAITTSKVSVADIVNDLVTNVADKPLSAAQGVVLKGLIDALQSMIPESYTLPTATETTLGGVKPVTATEAMTQPVGVTADGRLVTKPSEGGSGISVTGATVGQTIRVAAVDDDGVPSEWEPVDFPSGGEEITAPVELIASGTIPAGQAAWTNIGDIGVTWGDLRQYKSIGILINNGTDSFTSFLNTTPVVKQQLNLGGKSVRSYTIFEFVDTEKTKIRFLGSASNNFWVVDMDGVISEAKWNPGSDAYFSFSIVPIKYADSDKVTLYTNVATTVESTWYIIGLTK